MKQEKLIKPNEKEIRDWQAELAGLVTEYVRLEDEKTEANADYNQRMGKLWEQIRLVEARLRENKWN